MQNKDFLLFRVCLQDLATPEVFEIPEDVLEDCYFNSMYVFITKKLGFFIQGSYRFGLQEDVVETPNEEAPNPDEPPKDF